MFLDKQLQFFVTLFSEKCGEVGVYVHECICENVCVCASMDIWVDVCLCARVCIYEYMCVCVSAYMGLCVCVPECIHGSVYLCA